MDRVVSMLRGGAKEQIGQWAAEGRIEKRPEAHRLAVSEAIPSEWVDEVFDAAARVAAQRERIAPKGAAEAKLAPKGKGWVEELEAIADSAELVATGLRIVAEGRAAEGQVAEEMERLGRLRSTAWVHAGRGGLF
jgi:hypothetical protein